MTQAPDIIEIQDRLIDAAEAGRLLGVSPRRVRQLARKLDWLIVPQRTRGGVQLRFVESEVRAHTSRPDLAPVDEPALAREIAELSGAEARRLQILSPILAATKDRRAGALAEQAAKHTLHANTLRRWLEAYWRHGAAGLSDRRRGNANARKYDLDVVEQAIYTLYANRLSPTIEQAYLGYGELRREEPQRALPEMPQRTFAYYVRRFVPALVARRRGGDGARAVRKSFVPPVARDWTGVRVMGLWMGDGTGWDQLVNWRGYQNPIRPWLLTWLDVRARKIVAWRMVDKVNAATAMLALRDGWRRYGLCDELYVDNGSEYENKNARGETIYKGRVEFAHLAGYLDQIGIRQRNAMVRNPESKAPQERWYATLSGSFLSLFDAYTGGNITSMTRKKDDARLKADLAAGRVLDQDEARELCGKIVAAYNAAPHDAHAGRTPNDVFDELYGKTADGTAEQIVVRVADRVLDQCLMRRKPKVIRNTGMELYGAMFGPERLDDPRFGAAVGRKGFIAWNPDDLSRVHLYAFNDHRQPVYVCDLYPQHGANAADEWELRRAFREKQAAEKQIAAAAAALTDRTIDVKGVLRRGRLHVDPAQAALEARFDAPQSPTDSADVLCFPAGAIPKPTPDTDAEAEGGITVTTLFGRV